MEITMNKEINEDKKIRQRKNKSEKYTIERQEILEELCVIMGMNVKNYYTLYELEKNEKLNKRIEELIPEIKKCYRCSALGYFSKNKTTDNNISLLKALFKMQNYEILTKRRQLEYENVKKLHTELHFIKKN